MNHEQWRNELAPYLLGALDPGEVAELDRHLAGCEECRAELEQLRPVARALPESVERVDPPARLRERVMAEVQSDAEADRSHVRHRHGGRGWGAWLRPAGALAAVSLIAVAVAFAVGGGGSGDQTSTVAAGKAPGVTAELVSSGDAGTLRLANLRRLSADEALQAWVQRGERIERAGDLFVSNPNGTAITEIENLEGVSAVMVTAEPRSGSAFPTSDPMVSVQIPN